MILDTRTTDVIRVVMGGAPALTQPDFYTSWLELNDGDPSVVFVPSESDGILDGVTPVTIIPGPTTDGNRVQAKFIAVFNKDTADVALTFDFFDGTLSRTILKVLLEPDWSVIWEPGGTWHVYDDNGLLVVGPAAGAAAANDVVQARRTSVLALTTSFVDVTLDATDVESDATVIEHNNTNTDDIDVKATALYKISYSGDIRAPAAGNSVITMDSRVRVNDTTVLPGSESSVGSFRVGGTGQVHAHVEQTFYDSLSANDKVTLQVSKVELSGSQTYNADRLKLTVERVK